MESNTTIVTACSNSECPYCKGTGIIKVDCATTGHEAYYQCYSNGSMTEIPAATAYASKLQVAEEQHKLLIKTLLELEEGKRKELQQENAELRRQNDKMKGMATGWRPLLEKVLVMNEMWGDLPGEFINEVKKFLYGE